MIAATSRPDLIDAALLRPGRLDRLLYCGFPSRLERARILAALARALPLAPDVDLEAVGTAFGIFQPSRGYWIPLSARESLHPCFAAVLARNHARRCSTLPLCAPSAFAAACSLGGAATEADSLNPSPPTPPRHHALPWP